MSMASPLQPNEPNTPHGLVRASRASCRMAPSASWIGVGMWPPSVGLPSTKPLHRRTSSFTSSGSDISQLRLSTPTPALEMPREMACAMAVVLPYAEA